jgi:hypothetical protein
MRKKNNSRHGGHRHNNRRHSGRGNDQQNLARQKHHATQMREKYQNMARDAQTNGERSDAEYYLQHADHYIRVLAHIAGIEAERQATREAQQANDADNDDSDDETSDKKSAPKDEDDNANDAAAEKPKPRAARGRRPSTKKKDAAENSEAAVAASKDIPLPTSMLTEIQT